MHGKSMCCTFICLPKEFWDTTISELHKVTYCYQVWLEGEWPSQPKPLPGEQNLLLESCYSEKQYLPLNWLIRNNYDDYFERGWEKVYKCLLKYVLRIIKK